MTNEKNEMGLRYCPCCKSLDLSFTSGFNGYRITCKFCGLNTGLCSCKEAAERQWNTRAASERERVKDLSLPVVEGEDWKLQSAEFHIYTGWKVNIIDANRMTGAIGNSKEGLQDAIKAARIQLARQEGE